MSCKVQKSVCSDCVTYVKSRIKFNTFNTFNNVVQFFTENQFSLLKAIAKDSIVAQPTSGKFIKEHKLSGASSVKAALKILEDKELVYRTNEGYVIYDRFMDLWLKRI